MPVTFCIALFLTLCSASASAAALDTAKIETVTGMKGSFDTKANVLKLSYPRSDLKVKVAGVTMTPAMGLTAWAAFTKHGDQTMVMGDIVLTEDQVNPVLGAALDHGLEVTALHNHFFEDTPRIFFMHIGGMGDESTLAQGVKAVFDTLETTSRVRPVFPHASINTAKSALEAKPLDEILSTKGQLDHGIYKATFALSTKMGGAAVGAAMGVNTWAAFAGKPGKAVVDGDFAMTEGQLQGVLKALHHSGIQIVAIHNHMVEESPRIVFLHYWGIGAADQLARGVRSALDAQASSSAR